MNQEMKEQLLTKRPIDLLFQLSIPAVIEMIVIGLYPLMDGIFAGKIIGQRAMTACGVAMPLTFFNSGVSTLLGVGSASVLSRAIGKGDQKTVDKIMGNLIYWVIFFSVIITIGGLVLAAIFWIPSLLLSSQILSLFGVEANLIAQGVGNFRLFYSVFILYGVMVMTITFFQSIGNGKKAGVIVMLRQLFLFIPAMILLPMAFGVKAVWFTQPLVDFIMIVVGIAMMINELKNMGQVKSDTK